MAKRMSKLWAKTRVTTHFPNKVSFEGAEVCFRTV